MKNLLRLQRGFTLIEMLIVLMIISILLLIAVPNMTKNTSVANEMGCEATIDLLQTQIGAYEIETGEQPDSIEDLSSYVTKTTCPDGSALTIDGSGKVVKITE